jgi:hypothetical protein
MANGILHSSSLNADMPGLDGEWEEADVRLVPHAWHAGQEGNERLVILSPDNDVLAIFLYFCKELMELGVKEIWTRAGVGESTRYLPIHILASNIGEPLCHVLPALHTLSGADCTSRFCTKHAALKAKPEQYLQDFGRREDDLCIEQAEEYLTKAWKHNTSCKTSDELRFSLYHHSNLTVDSLPPPSYALVGHIQRAFYSAFNQINCLEITRLDPKDYGYEEVPGDTGPILLPSTRQRRLPDDLTCSCNCKKCAFDKSCKCRREKVPCCVFCGCRQESEGLSDCKNPYIVLHIPLIVDGH